MIKTILVGQERTKIDYKIIEYVNENLKIIIHVFKDYLYMDKEHGDNYLLSYVFPRDYLNRNMEECRNIVDELYEIICSGTIREYIKPKYEYVLYHIIQWWIDINEDDEDYIPIKLEGKLREEIEKNTEYIDEYDDNLMLQELENIESYLWFCFDDYDFLPESLDCIVTLYIKSPQICETLFQDVDLDDYIDFMAVDLKELYIDRRDNYINANKHINDINKNSTNKEWSEEELIKELYNSLTLLSNHVVENYNKDEVEISNAIFRSTKRLFKKCFGLELERESEIGHSIKKLGENDFYIYINDKEYKNIAIGENKYLEKFSDAYGQVLGYLNHTFKFGFTISINKQKTIEVGYKFILGQLKKNRYEDFKFNDIIENPFGLDYKYLIKSVHTIPEDEKRTMNIYHLILDLNNDVRKKVARESRRKNK
ncbi:hypothetical protein FDB79_15485 [Clostridium botulinum]|nr:hypothetical protein [Clostridium botulinum]